MTAGVVIVGNGHAGFQVAVSLRKLGFAGPVTLVGDEDGLPYQRPPLSKEWLHGTLGTDDLPFRPRSFYKKKDIDLLAGEQVVGIDREGGTVDLASGATLGYENLVLATGARCRPVDIDGIGLDGVVQLRTRADAEDLNIRLDAARRVVVVGGGFIGLEAAAAASKRGAEVTVIEAADRVMARVVSPGIMRGTNWIDDAPVPMTATRSPVRSWSWSHAAEWNVVPAKRSRPGASGSLGSLSGPLAMMSTVAVWVPAGVSISHRPVSATHRASMSGVWKRTWRTTSWSSAVRRR